MADTPRSHMANHRIPAHTARVLASALGLAALSACGEVPLPRPAEPLPPTAAAASAALPRLGLVGADGPPDEGLSEGTVSAFTVRFEPVPLPPGTPTIVDVRGRDERDVWLLAGNGQVLRWDGARLVDRGTPHCLVESCCGTLVDCAKQPAMCKKPAVDSAREVTWSHLVLTPGEVVARTVVDTGGMRGSVVEARLGANGRWSCEQGKDDRVYPGSAGRGDGLRAFELSLGGASFHFEGPAVLVNSYGGHLLLADGRRVPLPAAVQQQGVGVPRARFTARAPDDLWLYADDGRVWRGNGLGWAPQPTDLNFVADLWFAAPSSVWLLGAMEEGQEQLIRRDLDKGGGQCFETPGAEHMLGDGRDFWLLGTEVLYHWDGAALRRTESPLELDDFGRSWRGPSGELWLVGSDPTAMVKKAGPKEGDEGIRAGAVLRLPGGQKP
jgi:hypothetical protein